MAVALIVILLIGGGTSVVADGAVPGDALYSVKVNVNEGVRGFFTFSEEAKAKWSARKAERRLEEAEELAIEGRLTAEVRANLESSFEASAESATRGASKLEAEGNASAAAEISSNFESSLRAHERILVSVSNAESKSRAEVSGLLVKVRARLGTVMQTRASAEANVTGAATADVEVAARGKARAAENKIAEVEKAIARANAEATAEAQAQLDIAKRVKANGDARLEAGAYTEAFSMYQSAMRTAQEAQLLVQISNNLNILIETDVVEQEIDSDSSVELEGRMESEDGVEIEGEGRIEIGL